MTYDDERADVRGILLALTLSLKSR